MPEPEKNYRFTGMTLTDLPRIYEIECACFPTPWNIESYIGELNNPASFYVVARDGDNPVAFGGIWIIEGHAHIVTMATDENHRRQGLARMIINKFVHECKNRNVEEITLEVRVNNEAAKNLYKSFGFVTVGIRPKYYTDTNEDALVMLMPLSKL